MVIWRGWGSLGVLLILAGAVLFAVIGELVTGESIHLLWTGTGILLGGVAAFVLGRYMNVTRPARQAAEWASQRSVELQQVVQSGQFTLGPGHLAPTSVAQTTGQADELMAAERAELAKSLRNRHTLYFIPLQWYGVIGIGLGAFVLYVGFFR